MPLPTATKQYSFKNGISSYKDLVFDEAEVDAPKGQEVLIKVHAVSLQYRDLMVAIGTYIAGNSDNLVPLSDAAGEIIAVGADVKGWKVGDRVCPNFATDHIHGPTDKAIHNTSMGCQAQGVLTQYKVVPAHSLVTIPEHLSYEEAWTLNLPCAALTAFSALHGPVPVKAGDFVVVLGTGGVSIFALQFAVASGATVIASDEKLKIAQKYGAKYLINYNKTPNWDEEILKITNGVGADHVIEVGGAGTIGRSMNAARMGSGQIPVIGVLTKGENQIRTIISRAITLRGINIGSVTQFKDMNRLIIANPTVTRPLIDKLFDFEHAIDAYAYLESQKHVGKVVIKVA